MKIYLSLFLVVLSILAVSSRNVDEDIETDDFSDIGEDPLDLITRLRHSGGNSLKHRRKRWQYDYGYNYPHPPPYYSDRRDDRYHQDLYPQILALLEEVSLHLKRQSSSPPQPIYIPYPVPQQPCMCPGFSASNKTNFPSVTWRWPYLDDTNQNWGFVETDEPDVSGGGSRPVSFDPIPPITARPQSQGGSQTRNDFTTQNRLERPTRCDTAVISCCQASANVAQQRRCFANFACDATYTRGVCNIKNVTRILDLFKKAYSVID